MAFNAKNLHYEKKVPAFLQRLQGQYSEDDRNSAAQQRMQQRPKKLNNGDDEDDAPTYVDGESGEIFGKEEYEQLVRGADREEVEKDDEGIAQVIEKLTGEDETEGGERVKRDEGRLSEQNIAEIGAGRKRKAGKIVGGDEERDAEARAATTADSTKAKNIKSPEEQAETPKKTSIKGKGGKKKIKLAFDED